MQRSLPVIYFIVRPLCSARDLSQDLYHLVSGASIEHKRDSESSTIDQATDVNFLITHNNKRRTQNETARTGLFTLLLQHPMQCFANKQNIK